MTSQEISAGTNAAYEAAMREAEGWRRAYERHTRRLIFLIRVSAGIAAGTVAALMWLLVR